MDILAKLNPSAPVPEPSAPIGWGIYNSIEKIFDGLGLMRGNWAIFKRFLFGAGIGTIVLLWLKPSYAFYRGEFRPWKILGDKEDAPATWIPWWSVTIFSGLIPALFI